MVSVRVGATIWSVGACEYLLEEPRSLGRDTPHRAPTPRAGRRQWVVHFWRSGAVSRGRRKRINALGVSALDGALARSRVVPSRAQVDPQRHPRSGSSATPPTGAGPGRRRGVDSERPPIEGRSRSRSRPGVAPSGIRRAAGKDSFAASRVPTGQAATILDPGATGALVRREAGWHEPRWSGSRA